MKKVILLLAPALVALSGCNVFATKVPGTGEVMTKLYTLEDANKLEVENISLRYKATFFGPSVNIYTSDTKKVEVVAQENLFDEIDVSINDGTLRISGDDDERYITKDITINIYGYTFVNTYFENIKAKFEAGTIGNEFYVKATDASSVILPDISLNNLEVYSFDASSVNGKSAIVVNNTTVQSSSASNVSFTSLTSKAGNFKSSSASNFSIQNMSLESASFIVKDASSANCMGSIDNATFDVRDASGFKGKDLTINTGSVIVNDASGLELTVNESLTGSIDDASSLSYYGVGTISVSKDNLSKIVKKD